MIVYTSNGTRIIAGEAIRIVPPDQLPVSVYDVKQHSRISSDAEIDNIIRLIVAATSYIENYTGLGLITQTWQQSFSAYPEVMPLLRRPVQSVVSIADLTVGGSPSALVDPTIYALSGMNAQRSLATITLANGQSWPSVTGTATEAVVVSYVVGFGLPEDVPEMLRHAILMLIGMWFDVRESPDLEPVHALLADWRPLGVA